MITEKQILDAKGHRAIVVLSDDFGHTHTYIHPTHVAVEDKEKPFPLGPVTLVPYDPEPELINIRKMMADREHAFLQWAIQHPEHKHDPVVLLHPENPNRPK